MPPRHGTRTKDRRTTEGQSQPGDRGSARFRDVKLNFERWRRGLRLFEQLETRAEAIAAERPAVQLCSP
jgi:hypothetical protein